MKKLIAIVLIAVMLTGCQLATEETLPDDAAQDRLVGIVVTREHLDLFDADAYLQDHLDDIMDGEEVNTSGYEGRIYAVERVEEETTEQGTKCTTTYYEFPHVDGLVFTTYQARTILEDGTVLADFTMSDSSEGIWDAYYHSKVTDAGHDYSGEGTIYIPDDWGEIGFYVNPVFQDSKGRLYLMGGTGLACASEHCSMSKTISEEYATEKDGVEAVQRSEFKINFQAVSIAQSVTILQLGADHQILEAQTCAPEEMPEELTPVEGCAYIILEEVTPKETRRQLLQPGDRTIRVFTRTEEIYCEGVVTDVIWPEA